MTTLPRILALLAVAVAVALPACSPAEVEARVMRLPPTAPADWGPIQAGPGCPWSAAEVDLLNRTLFFLHETFQADDPRRALVKTAHFIPFDAYAPEDEPLPENVEALYSVRTGNVYLKRLSQVGCAVIAANIAHELHHMQEGDGVSINRMHECDRERHAHAREATDIDRMIAALPPSSPDTAQWRSALELEEAKARALSAMYNSKFELFRLVQAWDRVDGLRDMRELYALYDRCIEIAQRKLATQHREELSLLDEMSVAIFETDAEAMVAGALQRAREALQACAPLEAEVTRLRTRAQNGTPR